MLKTSVIKLFMCGIVLSLASGCMSIAAYNASMREQSLKQARAHNNTAAIQVLTFGGSAVGLGVEVSNWDAIMAHPFKQLLAGLTDLAAGAGAYKLLDNYTSHRSEKHIYFNGSNNSYTEMIGDGNTRTYEQDNSSHQ